MYIKDHKKIIYVHVIRKLYIKHKLMQMSNKLVGLFMLFFYGIHSFHACILFLHSDRLMHNRCQFAH